MAQRMVDTRWSLVISAGGEGERAHAALTELCKIYWRPVYSFIRSRDSRGHEVALDLTQGFFLSLLERKDVASCDPERGRFRSWLLKTVKSYLANDWNHRTAQKRDERKLLWLDSEQADSWFSLGLIDVSDPERAYDFSWAHALLQRALLRLGDLYAQRGKAQLFAETKHLLVSSGATASDYVGPAQMLSMRPETLEVQVHRMRQTFSSMVRAEVAELVEGDPEIDQELAVLSSALFTGRP